MADKVRYNELVKFQTELKINVEHYIAYGRVLNVDLMNIKAFRSLINEMAESYDAEGLFINLKRLNIISPNGKTEWSIASPFYNCRPSVCRHYCYALKGNTAYENALLKAVKIDVAIRQDPERVADMVSAEWWELKHRPEVLRIFDRGDFDADGCYLRFILRLNQNGIRCHVFSKKPEQLALVPDVNIRLLSVDDSCLDRAEGNNLPLAVVYTEGLIDKLSPYIDRIQTILPVQGKGQDISKMVSEILNVHPELLPHMCPCDSGFSDQGCPECDHKCGDGVGCYHEQTTSTIKFFR